MHYYELDELSGTAAFDAKLAVDGVYSGSPTLGQTGIPAGGTAVHFAGGATSAQNMNTIAFSISGTGFSLEFWVYLATNPAVTQNLCLAAHPVSSTEYAASLYMLSTLVPQWFVNDGTGHTIAANGALCGCTWTVCFRPQRRRTGRR